MLKQLLISVDGTLEMVQALSLINDYASLFRKMINSKVRSSDDTIKHLLKLSKDEDWNFLTAAMDIIDDASGAIGHVTRLTSGWQFGWQSIPVTTR